MRERHAVKAGKFLQILAVSLSLSAYAAWISSTRETHPAAVPSPGRGIPLVRTAEAEVLWHDKATLFLDVRPAPDFAHGHIAGALHLPEEEFEQRFPSLSPRLARARAIVVYCQSVNCGKSLWAAIRLRNEGLTQAQIYPAGWNEWQERGLPTAP